MADATSRLSSNGRVTIPKEMRDALGLQPGDEVVMRVDGSRVVLARTSALLGPDRGAEVPAAVSGATPDGVRRPPAERDDRRPARPLRDDLFADVEPRRMAGRAYDRPERRRS